MKAIIFGTGYQYEKYKSRLAGTQVIALADNDASKQGTYIDGKKVISPKEVLDYDFNYIFLMSKQYSSMRKQLLLLGVPEEKIIDCEHRGEFKNVRSVMQYRISDCDIKHKKKLLLVSPGLSNTGAPIALLYLAQRLINLGFSVEIYSIADGTLMSDIIEKGISVTIFNDFDFSEEEINNFFSGFDAIFVNTILLHDLVQRIQVEGIPVIWWLHEAENYYDECDISPQKLEFRENVSIYGVSSRAQKAFYKYSNGKQIERFAYAIPQCIVEHRNKRDDEPIVFAIIGTVDYRKAQDVLISAIQCSIEEWQNRAEFWIIGDIDKEKRELYEKVPMVKVFGAIDHDELMNLHSEIDVVVCPSRNDPLPIVLTEAMMNRKVCIASDMTGTAELIKNMESGLICHAGDVDSLKGTIDWVINNRTKLAVMGDKAYEVYENNFSQVHFVEEIKRILARYDVKN